MCAISAFLCVTHDTHLFRVDKNSLSRIKYTTCGDKRKDKKLRKSKNVKNAQFYDALILGIIVYELNAHIYEDTSVNSSPNFIRAAILLRLCGEQVFFTLFIGAISGV